MYCKNCGHELDPNAAICVNCGFANGNGNKYCANCGSEMTEGQAFCINCGFAVNQNNPQVKKSNKSKISAGILGLLVGSLGVHNFYLGYTNKAIAQLLITLLSCGFLSGISGIWGFIEGVEILMGKINKDGAGNLLQD